MTVLFWCAVAKERADATNRGNETLVRTELLLLLLSKRIHVVVEDAPAAKAAKLQ